MAERTLNEKRVEELCAALQQGLNTKDFSAFAATVARAVGAQQAVRDVLTNVVGASPGEVDELTHQAAIKALTQE